jgi:hypothetical protein
MSRPRLADRVSTRGFDGEAGIAVFGFGKVSAAGSPGGLALPHRDGEAAVSTNRVDDVERPADRH